jgi:hypothetical protein
VKYFGELWMLMSRRITYICAIAFLAIPLLIVYLITLDHMRLLPGDFGDARLNNYFLENIYQVLTGNSPSLFHLTFFYPYPYVIGLSDNLFGSSPIYLVARAITGQSDTAFQVWYLVGYIVNYLPAYYSLRRLDHSAIASAAGAMIFAFALPVTAHSDHAQLHYRFGVPLSVLSYIIFLQRKDYQYLVFAGGWLVWQFYCSIYMGFFLLLLLLAMTFIYQIYYIFVASNAGKELQMFVKQWNDTRLSKKLTILVAAGTLLLLIAILFYPYAQVTMIYGVKRPWEEIASMLPRPESYFLSDISRLWASRSDVFAALPMRHEHQMFVGTVPMVLALVGLSVGSKVKNGLAYVLLPGSLGTLMLLTLYSGGFTLWYLFAKLPLASGIRAMTRIDQVLLFPVAFLGSVAIDWLLAKPGWGRGAAMAMIPLLIFEFSATSPGVSSKDEWRHRLLASDQAVPANLPENAILFFAQSDGPLYADELGGLALNHGFPPLNGYSWYADELDGMWVALNRGFPTMNGYSRSFPPGYWPHYGRDCAEIPKRIASFIQFSGQQLAGDAYRKLVQRVVPIGFVGCDAQWLIKPPYTFSERVYTADEFKTLSLQYVGRESHFGWSYIVVSIANSRGTPISAASSLGKPVRLSWHFIDADGHPLSDWDTRKDLPSDVPAAGKLEVRIPLDPGMASSAAAVEVSIVQEFVFWGHDVGVRPLAINLRSQ